MASPRDDKHILSEFEDQERKYIMDELNRSYPNLMKLQRPEFFAFWFADIKVLRRLVRPSKNRRDQLAMMTAFRGVVNVPSLCEYFINVFDNKPQLTSTPKSVAGGAKVSKKRQPETEDTGADADVEAGESARGRGEHRVQEASGSQTRSRSLIPVLIGSRVSLPRKRTRSQMESPALYPGTIETDVRKVCFSNMTRENRGKLSLTDLRHKSPAHGKPFWLRPRIRLPYEMGIAAS